MTSGDQWDLPPAADQAQREHAVVRPQRVVLAQVDLGGEVGLGVVAVAADGAEREPDRGGVEVEPDVAEGLDHGGLVGVGPAGRHLVVAALPAHEEVTDRLVGRRLLEAGGQPGCDEGERECQAQGTTGETRLAAPLAPDGARHGPPHIPVVLLLT